MSKGSFILYLCIMKKKMLIGALVVAFVLAAACGKEAQPAQKSALEVIKARTSIRSFTGEKLSEEQINTLLDAAMAAPTAANEQPWRVELFTEISWLVPLLYDYVQENKANGYTRSWSEWKKEKFGLK